MIRESLEAFTERKNKKEAGESFEATPLGDIKALGNAERVIAGIRQETGSERWKLFSSSFFEKVADILAKRYRTLELEDREQSIRERGSSGQIRRAESWLQQVIERSIINDPEMEEFFSHPELGKIVSEKTDGRMEPDALQKSVEGAKAVRDYALEVSKEEGVHLGTNLVLDAKHQIDLVEVREMSGESMGVCLTQIKRGAVSEEESVSIHAAHEKYLKHRLNAMEELGIDKTNRNLRKAISSPDSKETESFLGFDLEGMWEALSGFVEDFEAGNEQQYSREVVERRAKDAGVPYAEFVVFLKMREKDFATVVSVIDPDFRGKLDALRYWAEDEHLSVDEIHSLYRKQAPNSILNAEKFTSKVVAQGKVVSEREIVGS